MERAPETSPSSFFVPNGSADRFTVRVSATPSIASNWLAHRISEFHGAWPNIDLDLQAVSSYADLGADDVDVAIRFIEKPLEDHYCVVLLDELLFPTCSPIYLQKVGALSTPSDLARTTLLRCSRMEPWASWFEAAGLDWMEPKTGPSFNEYPLLLDAAANGAGVALVGEILSASFIRSGRLVRLFDVAVPQRRRYFVVCRPSKLSQPHVAAFVDWLLIEAKEHVFKGAEERLRQGSSHLQAMIENLSAGAILVEEEGVTLNKAAESITGYRADEVHSLDDWLQKLYGRRSSTARQRYEREKAAGGSVAHSGPIFRKDGTKRIVEFLNLVNAGGEVWLMHDITERKEIESRMRNLAYYDSLTSLPNRLFFEQEIARALERARSRGHQFGVLYVDLDGFKSVNDGLGHDAGDHVLKEVAQRMKRSLRDHDVAARLGGDEFAAIVDEVNERAEVETAARRLLANLCAPMAFNQASTHVGASIGIAMFPGDAQSGADLLKRADEAMYQAKADGKNCYRVYATATPAKKS